MAPNRSPPIALRIALTLLAVLIVDLVFVGAVVALLAPVVARIGTALAPSVPTVAWLAALVLLSLAGLVVVQLRTARSMTLANTDVSRVEEADDPALIERVRRLAALADTTPPAVGRVDSDVPNCFSVGGSGPMIVVSDGLLDRLTDAELDAVLAHELAHIQNKDATVLTLATFLPTLVSDRPVAGLPRWLRSNLFGGAVVFVLVVAVGWSGMASPVAITITAVISLVLGGVALGVLATPVVYLSHRLSYDREFAADRAGARLAGDPEALVSALRKLDDDVDTVPKQDLRSMGGLVQELCLLPHGFVREDDEQYVDTSDGFAIRLRSHPPTSDRIENLQTLAADLET